MKTVWIFYDTNHQMGDVDHLKVFATVDAANASLAEHHAEGVAWEYPMLEAAAPRR